jgi:hypothetical protein
MYYSPKEHRECAPIPCILSSSLRCPHSGTACSSASSHQHAPAHTAGTSTRSHAAGQYRNTPCAPEYHTSCTCKADCFHRPPSQCQPQSTRSIPPSPPIRCRCRSWAWRRPKYLRFAEAGTTPACPSRVCAVKRSHHAEAGTTPASLARRIQARFLYAAVCMPPKRSHSRACRGEAHPQDKFRIPKRACTPGVLRVVPGCRKAPKPG